MADTYAPFYNVSSKVGPTSASVKSDVMLVQYFLFYVCVGSSATWPASPAFGPTVPGNASPHALLPFNGVWTPELGIWIRNFQQTANARGLGPLVADGAVNPARVSWGLPNAKRSGWFTIQALNRLMWVKNFRAFSNLPYVDDVPLDLRTALAPVTLI